MGDTLSGKYRWFEDPTVVKQMPLLYRLYALHCRHMYNPTTGKIRGGSFLIRNLASVSRVLGLFNAVRVEIDGLVIFADLTDGRIFDIFDEIKSDTGEKRLLHSLLAPGDTFLDIGANHGSFALMAKRLVGPEGLVVAFEPNPKLANLITKSMTENNFDGWEVHEIALGDREGEAAFYISSYGSSVAGLFPGFSAKAKHHTTMVRLAKLDDAFDWREFPGKVVMKIDVEGSELLVLSGAEQMIAAERPVIIFEINCRAAEAAGHSIEDLLLIFKKLGYEHFAEVSAYPETIPLGEIDTTKFQNIVALPD